MTEPWLKDADVTLYHGDVLNTLRQLPAESVDCVVTSPPYWGLRDYGAEGQLGLEPTPEQYVERMVEVFREVRRVLAAHGTVWLNLGDSYTSGATETGRNDQGSGYGRSQESGAAVQDQVRRNRRVSLRHGLKPKDLVGIPWRVAFALQADGWYLRSDIIWAKPNPMPESVTDRPTKAHEYVFLLSKQAKYHFDQEAVREAATYADAGEQLGIVRGTKRRASANGRGQEASGNESPSRAYAVDALIPAGRNTRSVWDIATQPYPEAHFATFPEELARRCIAAGCPEQVCRVCGKARVVEREVTNRVEAGRGLNGDRADGGKACNADRSFTTLGFTRCACGEYLNERDELVEPWDKYRPGIVLDPFMGSGTVAHVARKLGRHAVGIDLSAEYLELAARRLQQQSLFADVNA